MADPNNTAQFLICAERYGQTFVAQTVACPTGYVFSSTELTCVHDGAPPDSHRITRDTKQCETSGPYCAGCDRMVVCALLEGRGLTAITNLSCSQIDPDMSCSRASCSTDPPTAPCDSSTSDGFQCLQKGYFPDPADCKKYHVCSDDMVHYTGSCELQFDPATESCDPPEGSPSCSPAPRECKSPNLAPVSLPSAPSYYSLCIPKPTSNRKAPYTYSLSVMRCPDGHVFDDKKLTCIRSCAGKPGRFADPDNCHNYFECSDAPGQGTKKTCPENYGFQAKRRLCVPEFMVENCAKTTTTSTPPKTSSTPAVTSTNKPNSEDSIQCRTQGKFPDKSDCTRYITCTPQYQNNVVTYTVNRKQCPLFTYFGSQSYCQFGFCK